jgi:hypothetical protein
MLAISSEQKMFFAMGLVIAKMDLSDIGCEGGSG